MECGVHNYHRKRIIFVLNIFVTVNADYTIVNYA